MALKINMEGSCFCIITGASQGIGRALAVECGNRMGPGSVLLLMARSLEGLQGTKDLVRSANVKVFIESVDLSQFDPDEMKKLLTKMTSDCDLKKFNVSMIIHNAGTIGDVSLSASKMDNVEVWRKYYDLNVFNIATLNSIFLSMFQNQEDDLVVVNITSLLAIKPFQGLPLYCSGKAAREMYFKVLAEECPTIKVLNYSPGPVQTAMVQTIIDDASNESLKTMFKTNQKEDKLLAPEQTAKKCFDVLVAGCYNSGDHIDYFD